MAEMVQGGQTRGEQVIRAAQLARAAQLVRAAQVARETPVRQSANGVRFATFGETGLADLDLDRMIEAVPAAIVAALKANTYYFVPLALREAAENTEGAAEGAEDSAGGERDSANSREGGFADSHEASFADNREGSVAGQKAEAAMVASAYAEEFSDAAICHRNVELGHGKRGVFISTRLMGDRFALSFEFFINVAHAFVEQAGVAAEFGEMVWKQAVENVRGETSLDAWEGRNLAFGRAADAQPEDAPAASRRGRGFGGQRMFGGVGRGGGAVASLDGSAGSFTSAQNAVDEKERGMYLEAAFSDAVAMYLLSLALDFDYSELREREYPLLAPAALAARLRCVAELFPPNPGYEFAVRYRRRA